MEDKNKDGMDKRIFCISCLVNSSYERKTHTYTTLRPLCLWRLVLYLHFRMLVNLRNAISEKWCQKWVKIFLCTVCAVFLVLFYIRFFKLDYQHLVPSWNWCAKLTIKRSNFSELFEHVFGFQSSSLQQKRCKLPVFSCCLYISPTFNYRFIDVDMIGKTTTGHQFFLLKFPNRCEFFERAKTKVSPFRYIFRKDFKSEMCLMKYFEINFHIDSGALLLRWRETETSSSNFLDVSVVPMNISVEILEVLENPRSPLPSPTFEKR